MRVVLFTSNALRHKFVANALARKADAFLAVSECNTHDGGDPSKAQRSLIEEHFAMRNKTEQKLFAGHEAFSCPVVPLLYKEVNLDYTYQVVKAFKPDLMVCFGASIIREPLLSLLPAGHFINLHLGLSPYYRGAGTNFWPFVNKELEYVGSTILHIDAGIDTGDIIAHVRPQFIPGDNVHQVGCRVIRDSVEQLGDLILRMKKGEPVNRVKQWDCPEAKIYRSRDFTEDVLRLYYKNLESGLVENYIHSKGKNIHLVGL